METSEVRPFDRVRNLSIWWKIPINFLLIALFVIYGSNSNDMGSENCYTNYDDMCPFFKAVTFNNFIEQTSCHYIASLSITVLAFTSESTQWFLTTWPFQFLGKVSYTLYLIHELIVVWAMRDTYNYFLS